MCGTLAGGNALAGAPVVDGVAVTVRQVGQFPRAGLEVRVAVVAQGAEPRNDIGPRNGAESRRAMLVGTAAIVVDVRGDEAVAKAVQPVVDAAALVVGVAEVEAEADVVRADFREEVRQERVVLVEEMDVLKGDGDAEAPRLLGGRVVTFLLGLIATLLASGLVRRLVPAERRSAAGRGARRSPPRRRR